MASCLCGFLLKSSLNEYEINFVRVLTKAGDAVAPFLFFKLNKAHIQTYPEIRDITDGILTIEVSGEGQATHLGQCTWYSEFQVDTTQNPNPQTGTMEFTAANGDQLFGAFPPARWMGKSMPSWGRSQLFLGRLFQRWKNMTPGSYPQQSQAST